MKNLVEISLVMIVKNEEATLQRCLESAQDIVDEIIVVDTGSTDRTKEIARSFGAKIYDFQWNNDFSAARNFALAQATKDWRLILDADEYIIKGSKEDILENLNKQYVGQVLIFNAFRNEEDISYAKTYVSRMIYKETQYTGRIHEQVDSSLPRVHMNIEIIHEGYLHIDKSGRNLPILFEVVQETPKDSYALYQLARTLSVSEQKEEALKWYKEFYKYSQKSESYRCAAIVDYLYTILGVGTLEGGHELIIEEEKNYHDSPDFNFVCAEFYHELILSNPQAYVSYLPLIESYYLKCLNLGETTKYESVLGSGSYAAAYNLGVWYEVSGQLDKAKICYELASEWGYEKAIQRMELLR